jgi:hypothetical protein
MSDLDLLFSSSETKEVEFDFKGSKILVKVKELSWSEKNQVLSKCFSYQSSGEISFDFDKYNKLMLRKLIVGIKVGATEVPTTEINDIFFNRLNPAIGSKLERIVPKAFTDIKSSYFFAGE